MNESIYCRELRDSHEKLWKYLEIEGKPEDIFNLQGFKEEDLLKAIKYRREEKKTFQINDENYWVYVMLYERYDAFPTGILGAFYDAGQLFAHSKGFPDFTGRGNLYPALEDFYKAGIQKFELIISEIEKKEQLKKYRDELTVERNRFYRIAPIFQFIKSEIRRDVEIGKINNSFNLIEHTNKSHYLEISEYKILVTLLAYFFGYKTFYREFYEKANFKFFKQVRKIEEKTTTTNKTNSKAQQTKPKSRKKNEQNAQLDAFIETTSRAGKVKKRHRY